MNIHKKYITLLLMVLFGESALFAQEEVSADTTRDTAPVPAAIEKENATKDWKQLFWMRPTLIFTRNLMGEETGVYTATNGFSGNAGNLMLRGLTTVNLDASPYIILEGLPVRQARHASPFVSGLYLSNLEFIHPMDIANVRVINNGYEAVMYGGRASNGLIEVGIQEGEPNSTSIEVVARGGIAQSNYKLNVMNSAQFRSYLYGMMENAGVAPSELQNNIIFDPDHAKYNHNTNWMDELERNGSFKDFQMKMKGGDGDTRYLFSLGYTSENEALTEANDQRFNLRFNLAYKISRKMRIVNSFSYNYGTSRFWGEGTDWDVNPVYLAATKAPFMSRNEYSDAGIRIDRLAGVDILGKSNPAWFKKNLENKGNSSRVDAVIKAFYELDEKTFLNTDIMITYNSATEKMHRAAQGIVADRYIERQNSKRSYSDYLLKWNLTANRNGIIGDAFKYDAKVGFSMENYEEKNVYGRKVNASTDDIVSINGDFADSLANGKYQHNVFQFIGHAGLNWKNRIRLGANLNLERSSNFGPDGSWNLYAGISLDGDVLKTPEQLLNLYARWGRTGNNEIRGAYYTEMYYTTKYYGYGGVYLGNIANNDLKPEITNNYDFGLNSSWFNHILDLKIGYYYRKTSDLFTQKAVAIEVGLDPQFENNGEVTNQGIEASAEIRLFQTPKFRWNVFANISSLKNEVKKLNNGAIVKSMDNFTGVAEAGEALGSFYGYKVLGVYRTAQEVKLKKADGQFYQAGDYIFEDKNKDGIINELDRQVIGSPLPDFFGGFGTSCTYKGLSFSVLFTYSYGNDIYNLFGNRLRSMTDYSNQSTDVVNRWISETHPGEGYLPRAAYGDPSHNFASSDRWVEDGSYLKMKNISVSYDIPMKNRSGFFKGLTVFANCSNVFTVTGYSGMDPEVFSSTHPLLRGVDTGASPNVRTYLFGLKLSL